MNEFARLMIDAWKKYPVKDLIWYPSFVYRVNHLFFTLEFFLYHYIPGYFLDFVAKVLGKKPTLVSNAAIVFYILTQFCSPRLQFMIES